ncbi:MAG: hypothetical protein H6739_27680 [Alphaproteobacteria bacterium]|nr:hypothetical protein [Alphaproteobacteria bacterium]
MTGLLRRHPIPLAVLVSLLLCLPTMGMPLWSDDHTHLLMIEDWLGLREPAAYTLQGQTDPLGLLNLFQFFVMPREQFAADVAAGALPWWADPDLSLGFWRPLPSFLELMDYRLFGLAPLGYHVHSMLWHLALVGAVGLLHRRALPAAGALATLLYAMDDARWLPMAWLANRNALIAAVPALLGLAAHLRWREDGWRPGALLGPLGVAVGLTGGEAAVGSFAYFFAYEAFAAPGAPRRRGLALAPFVVLGGAWAVAYKTMGYGSSGSGLYIDPVGEPAAYLAAAGERAPILVGAMLGMLPSEASTAVPALIPVAVALGLLAAGVVGAMLNAAWPELPEETRRGLRWLGPGAVLALAPILATFPLDRLLLLPGIGGSAVIAVALRWAWRRPRSRVRQGLGVAGVLLHVVLPLPMWVGFPMLFSTENDKLDALRASAFPEPEALTDKDVVVLVASDITIVMYMPAWGLLHDAPEPGSYQILSAVPRDHRITRTAPDRLELEILDGGLFDGMMTKLTRSPGRPFAVGDVVEQRGATIEVLEVGPRGPTRLGVTLRGEREVYPIAWVDGALVPVALPEVGASMLIPWTPGPMGL